MRVLSINDYSSERGGAEVVWRRTHELLNEVGVESRVLAADTVVTKRTPLSYLSSRAFARAVEGVVADWRPDIVHVHNFYHLCSPSFLTVLGQARHRGEVAGVVATAHDLHLLCPSPGMMRWSGQPGDFTLVDPSTPPGVREKLFWCWDEQGRSRSLLRAAQHLYAYDLRGFQEVFDLVLCPSEFLARSLSAAVETVVLPNPVPPVRPPTERSGEVVALYAGRIVPEKGLVGFLEMAPRSFADRLLVAGDGAAEDHAREVAQRRGLHTQFLGRLSHGDVLETLDRVHVVVLPSRCYENAPTILFEALSRGANLLASDLGGVREIVEQSGTGFLFDPWSSASVGDAVAAVGRAFRTSSLNSFDAGEYLANRSEATYIARLVQIYERQLATR